MYSGTFQSGMRFMRGFFTCTEITPNLTFLLWNIMFPATLTSIFEGLTILDTILL